MTNTNTQEKVRISKEMTIDEILGLFPQKGQRLAQEITNAGLHCVGCHAATWETLEAGMLGHGMTENDIQRLVDRLNALLDEEPQDATTITITPRAARKYLDILAEEGKANWGLRFGERPAGCSGFEYVLDYQEKALTDDETFNSNGVAIHVNKALIDRLLGCEIDYVDGLHGSGFKVSNPHVRASCGCGSSHGY
jgi:iron-sulfur cluster assembly accessory protein